MTRRPCDNEPTHLVLDWNGTLIDDLDLAVESVNICAQHFGVESVTRHDYRRHFGFPIKDFYSRLGFGFDELPFDELVKLYLGHFNRHVGDCKLHDGVSELLKRLAPRPEITLSILSASHKDVLETTISGMGIRECFDFVVGLDDENGASKRAAATRLSTMSPTPVGRTVLVGDTDHDYDVAQYCGWSAHLVSCGHQDEERLAKLNRPVWFDVSEFASNVEPFGPIPQKENRT